MKEGNEMGSNEPGNAICIPTYVPTYKKGIYCLNEMMPENGGRYCE